MAYTSRVRRGMAVAVVSLLVLGCGLTELLYPQSTRQPPITATKPPTTSPLGGSTPTDTPGPPDAPAPTSTSTTTPQPAAAATDTPQPPPADTATPTATPTLPGLRIETFDVQMADAPGGGKLINCFWSTSGASHVQVFVGVRQRFPVWQEGEPDGSASFEVAETLYDMPKVTITAFRSGGGEATEAVTLDWHCSHTYFFAGSLDVPALCPSGDWTTAQGAQQTFQGGAMLWIPGVDGGDRIYALYDDGSWQSFPDSWEEGMPSHDPSIVPPAGLVQPVRGFGKVWREHASVRDELDWGTAHESSVVILHQRQASESLGGVQFIHPAAADLLELSGLGGSGSTWRAIQ